MGTKKALASYRALAELRYQIRSFLAFSERAARQAGLEPQQHQMLLALEGLPPDARPTIGTLAERMFLQHHSAVELVDRLSRLGLVRRKKSELDGREVLVEATRSGRALLEKLSVAHRVELGTDGPRLVAALETLLGKRRTGHRPKRRELSRK